VKVATVGESLYWSYANLAMAHAAVSEGAAKYQRLHFIIRSRLYAGLKKGTMSIGPLADDEKLKLILPQACCYCGSKQNLSVDHLIPQSKGGRDSGDNMVWACRSCNSSKCATDALDWLAKREQFPPLLLLRRYLKMSIEYCVANQLLTAPLADVQELPFSLSAIPHRFPAPRELCLWVESDGNSFGIPPRSE
jgi:hypothetical protein